MDVVGAVDAEAVVRVVDLLLGPAGPGGHVLDAGADLWVLLVEVVQSGADHEHDRADGGEDVEGFGDVDDGVHVGVLTFGG